MVSLISAAVFFVAIHLGIAGTRLRGAVVGRLGERGFMIAFSLASVAGMAWLATAYAEAPFEPLWPQFETWKLVADVLMLPAFVLVVVGLLTPNPTAVAQDRLVDRPVRGIVQVTRHPFLMGVALWALLHLVANGDLASVLLFGALLVVAVAGAPSIDAKRRHSLRAAAWGGFAAQTSIVPFAAIAAGRVRFVPATIGWWRVALAVLAYAIFIGGHRHIIGVSPFPHWS